VGRAAALLVLVVLLAVYYGIAPELPRLSDWAYVAFVSLALFPAMFALVLLCLPLRDRARSEHLVLAFAALGALAALFRVAGLETASNFAKFGAVVAAGWFFLLFFEHVSWVLLVALLIAPVDIVSVAMGPTKVITEKKPQVFDALSVFFPVPGEHTSAQLGVPDILFFALFLAATRRFRLRTRLSWVLMVASFGGTLALAVGLDRAGVAALPLLSAAFVAANADRLFRAVRALRTSRA
jgi:hypothetical protein